MAAFINIVNFKHTQQSSWTMFAVRRAYPLKSGWPLLRFVATSTLKLSRPLGCFLRSQNLYRLVINTNTTPTSARAHTATETQNTQRKREKMKYVLVTGGVVSGLGKGVTASSIGVVLKACGLRVTSIKIGYLLSPITSVSFLVLLG